MVYCTIVSRVTNLQNSLWPVVWRQAGGQQPDLEESMKGKGESEPDVNDLKLTSPHSKCLETLPINKD